MGFLEDFWANINAGATTIATAPDPIINIGQPRKKPTPTPTPTPTTTTTSGGNTPANTRRSDQQIYDLIETYHGDDISRHDTQLIKMGSDMTTMGEHQTKIGKAVVRLDAEDIILHEKHLDQEGRISENAQAIATHGHDYAGIDHTHSNGNNEKDCGWFGEKCWFDTPDWDLGWIKWLGLAVVIGILLWLIRPLFKIGANLTK